MSVEALTEWALNLKIATEVKAGEKQCRWCCKKATCRVLHATVETAVEHYSPVGQLKSEDLRDAMSKVDLVEQWCKAVRGEVEKRLLNGVPVAGYKLVQGRAGARAWTDPTVVEEYLRDTVKLKHDQVYDQKLISPTTAEKLVKSGEIGPRQWQKLLEHIQQKTGSPSVAPESDKRPAIQPVDISSEFQPILGD